MKNYKTAKEIIKSYRLRKDTEYLELKTIVEKLGYEVFEFQRYNPKHETLLTRIKAIDISLHSNGFTHEDEVTRIVFIQSVLSEEEKKTALLHELIHIHQGHTAQIKQISTKQEKETTDIHFIIDFVLKYEKMLRAFMLIEFTLITTMIILAVNIKTAVFSPQQQQLSDYVYITPTGYHYHTENCTYGGEYDNSFKVSRADAELYYLPCSNCNADKY